MKVKSAILLAAAILCAAACARNEHDEFRQALRQQYLMMEEFTAAVNQAEVPEEIAAALEQFRREAVAGREWMLRLTTEHPALADLDKADLPGQVREELDRIEEVTPRFVDALLRVEREFGEDPEVRRALDELGPALSSPAR